jgi:hypothetical protein
MTPPQKLLKNRKKLALNPQKTLKTSKTNKKLKKSTENPFKTRKKPAIFH